MSVPSRATLALSFAAAFGVNTAGAEGGKAASTTTTASLADHMSQESRSEPDGRAIRGGLVLFGASYAIAVGGGASQGFERGTAWLLAPVAGPWIAMGTEADANGWGLAMLGTAETVGAASISYGFLQPRRVLGPAASLRLQPVVPVGRGPSPGTGWQRPALGMTGLRLVGSF